jgi:hypothetical protein
MRLHSSDEVFTGKEPWKFGADSERVMRRFLKLRHELVPYIYTMNERFYSKNRPLIEPIYYRHPDEEDAYRIKNEYYFGSELLVNPITSRSDPQTRTGAAKTWLPEGMWFDFFTGMRYRGGRLITMHRDIDTIPVLAKCGGIVPMQAGEELSSRTENPKHMVVKVFCGSSGAFRLYEDDGISMNYLQGEFVTTNYHLDWSEKKQFVIEPAEGKTDLIPSYRRYSVDFYGIAKDSVDRVELDGQVVEYTSSYDEKRQILTVEIVGCNIRRRLVIVIKSETKLLENPVIPFAYEALNRAQIPFAEKEKTYQILNSDRDPAAKLSTIEAMYMPDEMKSVIRELILA